MASAWHRSEYLLDGGDTPLLSMLKKYHSDNVSAKDYCNAFYSGVKIFVELTIAPSPVDFFGYRKIAHLRPSHIDTDDV